MDFQALLAQISELEAANVEEQRKFIEESAKHKNTRDELQRVLATVERLSNKAVTYEDTIAKQETDIAALRKLVDQLKEAVKNGKQEIALLQQHNAEEKEALKRKRAEMTAEVEIINEGMRKMRQVLDQDEAAAALHRAEEEIAKLKQAASTPAPDSAKVAELQVELSQAKAAQAKAEEAAAGLTAQLAAAEELKKKQGEELAAHREFGELEGYAEKLRQRETELLQALSTKVCPACASGPSASV